MERTDDRYASPTLECDLVMEGGITSGVVYPPALLKLATKYCFRCVGGTSAGAIAAALAAATELGRNAGGFQKLEALPAEIGEKLLGLFQPRPEYRGVFAIFISCLGQKSWLLKLLKIKWAIVRYYGLAVAVGLAPAVAVGWSLYRGTWPTYSIALVVILIVIGPLITVSAWILWRLLCGLPKSGFGLCPGLQQPGVAQVALTPWLITKLNDLAATSGRLLTIRDLKEREVILRTMTTNVSQHRPHALPFSDSTAGIYGFLPSEWREFFPENVVQWLIDHGKPMKDFPNYYHLPQAEDWPVIVLVRLSLSFPILLSAIPLYCRDYAHAKGAVESSALKRCWFSDGGIASNFPIHFFDSMLPSRPTFGIRLGDYSEDRDGPPNVPRNRVYMPKTARGGQLLGVDDIQSVGSFLAAIVDTARVWQFSLQGTLSGYRERIARIALDSKKEGGLNINMPPELVTTLAGYGAIAGDDMLTFDLNEHRWRRFLVAYARLEETLSQMSAAYVDKGFREFLQTYPAHAKSYPPKEQWMTDVALRFHDLMAIAENCRTNPLAQHGNIPKPQTDLRITPQM